MNDVEIIMYSLVPMIQLLIVIFILILYLNRMQVTISNMRMSVKRSQELCTGKPHVSVRPRIVSPQPGKFHNTTVHSAVEPEYMAMV